MKHIHEIFKTLDTIIPELDVPVMELVQAQTDDPFKILLGTILSARTKDQVTAKACERLFQRVDTVQDLKKLSVKELEELIYPVGFYQTKARHLKELPNVLEKEFNNTLPQTVEELTVLPGVGRKTANLVVALGFRKPSICVDVHVHRISNRLDILRTKTPLETEMRLRKTLPKEYWLKINWYLVALGQKICTPISPYCSQCPLKKYCRQRGVKTTR